jgi:hypothetical protein
MPDWQLITVLGLIAGAAGFLAVRVARLFKVRHGESSACGGACHGCHQPAPSNNVVSLEAPKSAPPETE